MNGHDRGEATKQNGRRVSLTPDLSPVEIARHCNEPFQRLRPRGKPQAVETARGSGVFSTWLKPGITERIWYDGRDGCLPPNR